MVEEGAQHGNRLVNAAGPEVLRYKELISVIMKVTGSRTRLLHTPPSLAILLARLLSIFLKDVLLTRDELAGLMQEGLYVAKDYFDGVRFSEWLTTHSDALGHHFTNELRRHH